MKGLILLSHYLISYPLYKLFDSLIFSGKVSIEFLQVGNREHYFFREIIYCFGFKVRVIVMIQFHLWYLTFFKASIMQRFNWESIESQAVSRVVEFPIVYIISNSYRQSLRHMTVELLLSDKLFVQHIVL